MPVSLFAYWFIFWLGISSPISSIATLPASLWANAEVSSEVALHAKKEPNPYLATAQAIRNHYEEILPSLPPDKQRHYAQRLYRVTGEAHYLPINQTYAKDLLQRINKEIDSLNHPGYSEQQAKEKLINYPTKTTKQKNRKAMLEQWGEIIYAKTLAFDLWQAQSYGLLTEAALPSYQKALAYLKTVDFASFLLDADVITIYAAQVANITYYLYYLDVIDLRQEVINTFRQQYPPERNAELTNSEYRNKIYGMTHFIIAASNYYQMSVDPNEFQWILTEFRHEIEKILTKTKEDIYTEVGLCFLLAGYKNDPIITQIQDSLLNAYNPDARMIPSEQGGIEKAKGEHRNVLAIMLFSWPKKLYLGPKL